MQTGEASVNPFVGLRPFESEDSLYFFGRNAQTQALLKKLHETRFLAVVGSSGSGKSSLIRAGLIPILEAGFLVQDRDLWQFARMKPGDSPLRNLSASLLGAGGDPPGNEAVREFTREIRARGVQAVLERIEPLMAEADVNLLLLVDQFEEIFRFGASEAGGEGRQDRADLVAIMLRLAEQTEVPIFVCMTMRSDYLGDCDEFYGLPEAMNRSQYLVPRLTRDQRREAIVSPIRLSGAKIAPRLVDRLLNETIDTRDDLPVLQHALLRTWANWAEQAQGPVDVEHYEAAHTIKAALDQHADEALQQLSADRKLIARRLFQTLTETDMGNRRIRRPAHLSEVVAIAESGPESVLEVIDMFRQDGRAFLVLSSGDPAADPLIDISHESLIRQWHRLSEWVSEEADSAAIYRRLAEAAHLYADNKADLYREASLEVALEWQADRQPNESWSRRYDDGFAAAMSFLQKSREARDREVQRLQRQQKERRFLRLAIGSLAVSALVIVGYVWYWAQLREADAQTAVAREQAAFASSQAFNAAAHAANAEAQARTARYWQLSFEAGINPAAWPQRSLLLAVEAVAAARDSGRSGGAGETSLRRTLFSTGGTVLPDSAGNVSTLAFSPDGRLLAAGGAKSHKPLVRLWNLGEPAREVVELRPGKPIAALAFSGDALATIAGGYQQEPGVSLWDLHSGVPESRLPSVQKDMSAAAFSPDGLYVVTACREIRGDDCQPGKRPYDPNRPLEVKLLALGGTAATSADWQTLNTDGLPRGSQEGDAVSFAFSPGGKYLAVGLNGGSIWLWILSDPSSAPRELEKVKPIPGWDGRPNQVKVHSMAFSPDGNTLAAFGAGDSTVMLWRTDGPAGLPGELPGHEPQLRSVAFSPDGRFVASGGADGSIRLWDARDWGSPPRVLRGHEAPVEALAFSPDSRLLASGGGNYERPGNAIRLWDLGNSWNGIPALQHDEDVGGIAFNSNDGTLATASGKQVRIWDPARPGAPTLRFGDRHVGLLAFSPDGSTLAAEQAYEVSLWIPAQSTEKPAAVLDHDNQIHSLAFSPDGRFLATGTSGTVLETASERREVERHMERLQDVSTIRARLQRWFRQARDVELTDAQLDRLVKKELEKEKSEIQREIDRGQDEVWFWRLSPDSRPDRPPARPVTAVRGHRHNIDALAYSPDGRILVSGSVDRSMRLWDVTKALNPVEEAVEEPGYVVTAVAVSRDSRVLAAAIDAHVSASPQANAVKLWDLDTTSGESTILMERAVFLGHEQGVTSVAINPDSDRIASGSKDGTARIWDLNVPGGNPVIAPTTGEKITSVAFSPDGETLAIAEGRSVLLWPQRIQVLIDMACQRAGRNLTRSEWKQYLGDSPYRATCPQWPVEEDAKK